MDQEIATLRAALEATEAAISQTEAALATASASDKPGLRAVLVDLKARRAELKLRLASLEAAAVEVRPLGAARVGLRAASAPVLRRPVTAKRRAEMKTIEKALRSSARDRSVTRASLALAKNVLKQTRRLLKIAPGTGRAPAKGRTRKTQGATTVRKSAKRRRSG